MNPFLRLQHVAKQVVLLIFLALLMIGCQGLAVGGVGAAHGGVTLASPTSTIATLLAQPREPATPSPKPRRTPIPSSTTTPAAPTTTPQPSATLTSMPSPSATNTPIAIACSPLVNYPLERLPKIVSDPYHPPPPGSDARHEGVDFAFNRLAGISVPIEGAGIQSVLAGRIAAAIQDSFPYGNFVIVETRSQALSPGLVERLGIAPHQSLYVLYAHMQNNLVVQEGQEVSACQRLGKVGKSGNTAVPHLHLETRLGPNGATFSEMAAFVGTITPLERSNYKLWRTSGVFNHFNPMILLTYLPE